MAKMGQKPRVRDEEQFYADFPALDKKNHKVTSPVTQSHNCIAFVMDDKYHKWWPGVWAFPDTVWPNGCSTEETVVAFEQAFSTKGYSACAEKDLQDGQEVIVLYTRIDDDGNVVPTHAAKRIHNRPGWWKSKISDNVDIEHTLDGLRSEKYGRATHFFARPGPRRMRRSK